MGQQRQAHLSGNTEPRNGSSQLVRGWGTQGRRPTDGLFHMDPDGTLRSMRVTACEAESVLQGLLTNHPDLLAGGQMRPDSPLSGSLVSQEHGVPDHDGTAGPAGADHLFVDQDAVPTLVEVKRSSDTRIRREVVGQMLDRRERVLF